MESAGEPDGVVRIGANSSGGRDLTGEDGLSDEEPEFSGECSVFAANEDSLSTELSFAIAVVFRLD